MPRTLLFVHGTGVRQDGYRIAAARVRAGLDGIAPDLRLEPCLWGPDEGARLAHDGASIPDFSGQTPPPAPSAQARLALWQLLAADAGFELRELSAARPAGSGVTPPAAQAALAAFPAQVAALGQQAALLAALPPQAGPADAAAAEWAQATAWVAACAPLAAALKALRRVDGTLREAVARACVAALQRQLADRQAGALTAGQRDALVQATLDTLGGRDMGRLGDWVSERFTGLALRWATDKARRQRDVLFNAAYPAAGDILRYQARGEALRRFIAGRLDACGDDVVVLAHSLGGIACVDLLVREPRPQVKLLVTVGSQAPLLYELGALVSLTPDQPLPAHFPTTWVNVFDRNDLLSYLAAPLFHPVARDLEVASDQPFPDAHGAYWDNPLLWTQLRPYLEP